MFEDWVSRFIEGDPLHIHVYSEVRTNLPQIKTVMPWISDVQT